MWGFQDVLCLGRGFTRLLMGMKQQAKKEHHLDLTCVALVLFTGVLKDTTHKAPESSTSPGWEDTLHRQSCAAKQGKNSAPVPSQHSPLLAEHPQGLWIPGMQLLFTVRGRSGMLLLTGEEGAATVMPHTCPRQGWALAHSPTRADPEPALQITPAQGPAGRPGTQHSAPATPVCALG